MAVSDIVLDGPISVANNDFLVIQPGVGAEWYIFNIMVDAGCELYWTNGTNDLKFDSSTSFNDFHYPSAKQLTNTRYIKVKNVSGNTALFSYSGVVWK